MEQDSELPESRRVHRVSWVCDHLARDGKESVHMAGTLAAKLVRHTRRGPPGQYAQARVYREDDCLKI